MNRISDDNTVYAGAELPATRVEDTAAERVAAVSDHKAALVAVVDPVKHGRLLLAKPEPVLERVRLGPVKDDRAVPLRGNTARA